MFMVVMSSVLLWVVVLWLKSVILLSECVMKECFLLLLGKFVLRCELSILRLVLVL